MGNSNEDYRDYNRPKESSFFEQNLLVAAGIGNVKEFDVPESVTVFVDKLSTLGTINGELSIAFGDAQGSPFLDLFGGDFIRCSPFTKVRVRNNTGAQHQVRLIFSADPNFQVFCAVGAAAGIPR